MKIFLRTERERQTVTGSHGIHGFTQVDSTRTRERERKRCLIEEDSPRSPTRRKNRMVIYPHVVTVDGSVSTEEAGVQVGLSQQKTTSPRSASRQDNP